MLTDEMKRFAEDVKLLAEQLRKLAAAGLPVAVDPDEADEMGAFVEDALSLEDALESRFDTVAEGE